MFLWDKGFSQLFKAQNLNQWLSLSVVFTCTISKSILERCSIFKFFEGLTKALAM